MLRRRVQVKTLTQWLLGSAYWYDLNVVQIVTSVEKRRAREVPSIQRRPQRVLRHSVRPLHPRYTGLLTRVSLGARFSESFKGVTVTYTV
jgi:hypothetical protein